MIEDPVAVVEHLGSDLADALHRARHRVPDGMVVVQQLHQLDVYLKSRGILRLPDLLTDDALFLLHALLREVGGGDELQEHLQVLLKVAGAFKVIDRHAGGGEGVGIGTVGGEDLQRVVSLGHVEHLVFQIVGDAGGSVQPVLPGAEAAEGSAVLRGKGGIGCGDALLGHHHETQSVGQGLGIPHFSDGRIFFFIHRSLLLPLPFPRPPLPGHLREGSTPDPGPRCGRCAVHPPP